MKSILQVCAFGAPNPGNFIASLLELQRKMNEYGYKTIYAFPEKARDKEWCKSLAMTNQVYFLPEAKARILPKTYQIFHRIYVENEIQIVHSHFELYDIPATVTAPKKVKIFWHLHDPLTISKDLRGILWKIQYGFIGKRAQLLSVTDYYRKMAIRLGFPEAQTRMIINCIDLDRIKCCRSEVAPEYDFLTFGWDFYRKGDDIILKACDRLYHEGYRFKLLLNGNEKTWRVLQDFLKNTGRPYLTKGNPVDDVNELFLNSRVFVQASRKETFSYAVCEAAYAGLPVICSDIAGLEWAHEIPLVDFFESENVEMLYFCMKEKLDSVVRNDDTTRSRSIIKEKYSLETWVNKIVDAYGIKGNV